MTRPNLVTRFHVLEFGVLVAITLTALVKVPLDEELSMHWNANGLIDWAWPPLLAFAILPLIGALTVVVSATLSARADKYRLEMVRHVLEPALTVVLGIAVALQFGLLLLGLNSDFDIIRLVAFAVAAGLLVLGILLREAQRHTYAGLRLPWAIPGDEAWSRVHVLAGWAYIAAAITLGLLATFQPFPGTLIVALPVVLVLPVVFARLASFSGAK
ncbi:MAG TPA: SdpI family protein [Devosiaceae bacterium]